MAKKVATAAVIDENSTTQVNIADFQRTRDSVIVALATLQSSVQDLSRAYIKHANTVLSPSRGGEVNSNLTTILTESGLLTGAAGPSVPVGEDLTAFDGKKKRKRAPHDPNAPKRALTPYFLYMQSARPEIAKELGDHAKPKEVADEGTRRWGEMSAAAKSVWDLQYQHNLAVYRVRMAAYKNHQPVPDEAEATRLVEEGKAPAFVAEEAGPVTEQEEEDEEEDESTPEPVKKPEPPKKKRKSEKAVETPAKETPKTAPKSSDKKSKKSKKEEEPAPEVAPSSKPEKKKRSKK